MPEISIRNAQPADADAMWALDLLCFTPEFQFSRRVMRRFANAPGAIALIAESAGTIAGFCIVQIERTSGYVVTLDVNIPYRRRGLSRRLMAEAELRSRAAGASAVDLHVHVDNHAAVNLYQSLGYTQVGAAQNFYGPNLHAMVYRKELAA